MTSRAVTLASNWALVSETDKTALRSCGEWALALTEAPTDTITEAQSKTIPGAMRAVTAITIPASREQMAVEMETLRRWAKAFKVPTPDLEAATASYLTALKHLPPDLLHEAFETMMATHKYGMRLPLPAEIAATVREKFSRRVRIKMGLIKASRARVEIETPNRVSADDWAKLRASMADTFPSNRSDATMEER